jgi:uncharacterized membrane protein
MRKRSAVLLRRPQGVDAVLEAITGCGCGGSAAYDVASRLRFTNPRARLQISSTVKPYARIMTFPGADAPTRPTPIRSPEISTAIDNGNCLVQYAAVLSTELVGIKRSGSSLKGYLHMNSKKTLDTSDSIANVPSTNHVHHFRFHLPFSHLTSVFGDDWFALKAETFARFFGTPFFLITQTLIVAFWIMINGVGFTKFDVYPFILLNLAFSLQAAYAAPLILLAQTRQADRDKTLAEADAQHREALALASEQRAIFANKQTEQLVELMQQNTKRRSAEVETTRCGVSRLACILAVQVASNATQEARNGL